MKNASSVTSRSSEIAPDSPAPIEYLSFKLGAVRYGIDILQVQEIRSYTPPIRLPHAADVFKGVIDLRGRIVPILDMRVKLQCAEVAYNALTVVIVLDLGTSVIGAVVDSVADVVTLAHESIKPAPQFEIHGHQAPSFIQGIANVDDQMLVLIDIAALLGPQDIRLADSAVAVA